MRNKLCYIIIGIGTTIGEAGAAVQELGWLIERGGMTLLDREDPRNVHVGNGELSAPDAYDLGTLP